MRLSPAGFVGTVLVAFAVAGPTADAAPMRAPSLEAPGSGAAVQASPTFTWGAVAKADKYEFQLSADRQFGSVLVPVTTKATAATLPGTLIDGSYYWRVRAVSVTGKAGRWSSTRELVKRWSTRAQLLSPTTDFGAVWPTSPLVLDWSAVPHAVSYNVVVATDPSLAQPVLGSLERPQTTTGTVLAFPGTLNAGTYYWQVTPLDADGHKGTPSAVGRFTWSWPSALALTIEDLNPSREVFDPLLRWTDVPGAARYDVEVNTTQEFAPGSVIATANVYGTAVSPTKQLPNNTYYWRVRAVDSDGRAGSYYTGSFSKEFDNVAPAATVGGLTLNERETPLTLPATATDAVLTWNPVPGAASYEVAVAPRENAPNALCQWTAGGVFGPVQSTITYNPYIDLAALGGGPDPGGIGQSTVQSHVMVDGKDYCSRVRAIDGAGNVSQWTYLGGANDQTAFTYSTPPAVVGPTDCSALPAPALGSPGVSATVQRTPKFHWSAVDGARTYYLILARDQSLTNIVDVALTDRTYYVPRKTYQDENTGLYWTVWPSRQANGACPTQVLSTRRFDKTSPPPAAQTPDNGASISGQPVFRWDAAEGAAQYRIQISKDVEFKEVIDDTTTASTVYAPSGTYPVDTQLYWRVRARDGNGVEPGWSTTRTFRRTLPVPVVDPANPTAGSRIPVLSWASVPGAISYDFHVDQVNGGGQDFKVATPRFTPTEFYGNGIWKWKVRANFPSSNGTVSGAYTASHEFVRRLLPPTNLRAVKATRRIVFSWDPDDAAKTYKLEIASDSSFTKMIGGLSTTNTSYAPSYEGPYTTRAKVYWRVASVDTGNNVGAFARGDLRGAPKLRVKGTRRSVRRGRRTTVRVTVTSPRGTKMRGVRVRVSGAGAAGSKTTSSKGTVTFRIRPTRKGTVKITASRNGYASGTLNLRAY